MKLFKSEKWKLEETTKRVCLFTTIYCSVMIFWSGQFYLVGFLASFIPYEFIDSFGDFIEGFINVMFSIFMVVNMLLYITKLIYVIPIIITMFLISVAFTELVKRKNPRVFVHPLVLSSIGTSFVWAFVVGKIIENSF